MSPGVLILAFIVGGGCIALNASWLPFTEPANHRRAALTAIGVAIIGVALYQEGREHGTAEEHQYVTKVNRHVAELEPLVEPEGKFTCRATGHVTVQFSPGSAVDKDLGPHLDQVLNRGWNCKMPIRVRQKGFHEHFGPKESDPFITYPTGECLSDSTAIGEILCPSNP